MSVSICTRDDEYVRELTRWVVRLDDGTTVYQDDDRPGVHPASAWVRLGIHCRETGLWIVEMRLQFRSNVVPVDPPDAPGYYFSKSASSVWGVGETQHAYIAGTLGDDDEVRVGRWQVPSLVLLGEEVRNVAAESPCLIRRPRGD